ncbi:MAG: SDR family oxidoreductase [Candidatus Omnitrophica bacterium]|nr:SDR family oxidoreductase [Candidatus Omnitrophota bacterium]
MPSSKVVFITGCSSGFGLLTAARLAGHGYRVFATMRDVSKKDLLLFEAEGRKGASNLTVLPMDVTNPESIRAAVREVAAASGVIDVLVNNAGIGMGGFFEDMTDGDYRDVFNVNFFGALNVIREVLPIMRPRKKGLIINVSSMAAFSGTPAFSAYVASKWALEGFSESLYMELKLQGIDVAVVEPGSYKTRIFKENARYATNFFNLQSPYFQVSQYLKDLVETHAQSNTRDPEEVAAVIENIINKPSPSFRYVIGFRSKLKLFMLRHIPFKFYAWMVRNVLFPKE